MEVCSTGIVSEGWDSVAVGFAVPHPAKRLNITDILARAIKKRFLIIIIFKHGRTILSPRPESGLPQFDLGGQDK
jgi:hypothetical protein